jgi:hypothetical protein
MHRSAATIVSRDVALAADETIGLSRVSASRSTPAAQSAGEPHSDPMRTERLHDTLRAHYTPHGGWGDPVPHCGISQANKQINKETSCTGTQRRALVAHVRVDHGRDALEAAVT